jgi:hypothetical protein
MAYPVRATDTGFAAISLSWIKTFYSLSTLGHPLTRISRRVAARTNRACVQKDSGVADHCLEINPCNPTASFPQRFPRASAPRSLSDFSRLTCESSCRANFVQRGPYTVHILTLTNDDTIQLQQQRPVRYENEARSSGSPTKKSTCSRSKGQSTRESQRDDLTIRQSTCFGGPVR